MGVYGYTSVDGLFVQTSEGKVLEASGTIGIMEYDAETARRRSHFVFSDQLETYEVDANRLELLLDGRPYSFGRTALGRLIHQELFRRGKEFPGHVLTATWDLVTGEDVVEIDGKKYNRFECAEEAVGHTLRPLSMLTNVAGSWYLERDVDTCPECGRRFPKGAECGYCRVTDWAGNIASRRECERVRIKDRKDAEPMTAWRRKDDPMEGMEMCEECGVWYPAGSLFHGMCDAPDCLGMEMESGESHRALKNPALIDGYHGHSKNLWYGEPGRDGRYVGLGFELEVDRSPRSLDYRCLFNNIAAEDAMLKSGLDWDECVFETDSSLSSGFEIISMPHTVEAFWKKKENWARLFEALREMGFKSHDTNSCGLHVHVSREMFGKTVKEQELALAKVHRFYHVWWDDLLKASRRKDTYYCQKNSSTGRDGRDLDKDSNIVRWKFAARRGSHHSAINESRYDTVEFRLCRGTLNPASFFAWIDLTLTMARNSKKSSKLLYDAREWLKGISPYTAEYLVSRGAFAEEIRELMPEAVWTLTTYESEEN